MQFVKLNFRFTPFLLAFIMRNSPYIKRTSAVRPYNEDAASIIARGRSMANALKFKRDDRTRSSYATNIGTSKEDNTSNNHDDDDDELAAYLASLNEKTKKPSAAVAKEKNLTPTSFRVPDAHAKGSSYLKAKSNSDFSIRKGSKDVLAKVKVQKDSHSSLLMRKVNNMTKQIRKVYKRQESDDSSDYGSDFAEFMGKPGKSKPQKITSGSADTGIETSSQSLKSGTSQSLNYRESRPSLKSDASGLSLKSRASSQSVKSDASSQSVKSRTSSQSLKSIVSSQSTKSDEKNEPIQEERLLNISRKYLKSVSREEPQVESVPSENEFYRKFSAVKTIDDLEEIETDIEEQAPSNDSVVDVKATAVSKDDNSSSIASQVEEEEEEESQKPLSEDSSISNDDVVVKPKFNLKTIDDLDSISSPSTPVPQNARKHTKEITENITLPEFADKDDRLEPEEHISNSNLTGTRTFRNKVESSGRQDNSYGIRPLATKHSNRHRASSSCVETSSMSETSTYVAPKSKPKHRARKIRVEMKDEAVQTPNSIACQTEETCEKSEDRNRYVIIHGTTNSELREPIPIETPAILENREFTSRLKLWTGSLERGKRSNFAVHRFNRIQPEWQPIPETSIHPDSFSQVPKLCENHPIAFPLQDDDLKENIEMINKIHDYDYENYKDLLSTHANVVKGFLSAQKRLRELEMDSLKTIQDLLNHDKTI